MEKYYTVFRDTIAKHSAILAEASIASKKVTKPMVYKNKPQVQTVAKK